MTRDDVANLVAGMWERMRYVSIERVDHVLRAVLSLAQLDDDPRVAAADAAHKLAGSLGTYGYGEGSVVARRAEELLRRGEVRCPAEHDAVIEGLVELQAALHRRPTAG